MIIYFSNLKLDAAINPIPTIPMIVAIPELFSAKILPWNIIYAPVKAVKSPTMKTIMLIFCGFFITNIINLCL